MKHMFLYLVPVLQDTISETSGITLSGLAKILALIGTLFAVLNAPSGISQLIGADLSVSSSLQSLQTTMIGTSLLGGAFRTSGSIAKDVGALGVYGLGRMLGGSSILQQNQAISSGSASPLVSNRSVFGGIQGGMEALSSASNAGPVDFMSGFVSNALPNIAKPISDYNRESGSFSSIAKNQNYSGLEKTARMGSMIVGWGSSRAYSAASNRVASIGHRSVSARPNNFNRISMMNTVSKNPDGEA